jgi:hypothetical protein
MRVALILLPVLLVAACDSPTPAVSRWNKATIETGGMTFGVHWNADRAEAFRTSKHWRPALGEVRANAAAAIGQASGCRVGSIDGDHAIVKAKLSC